jgi:hypothetical protein
MGIFKSKVEKELKKFPLRYLENLNICIRDNKEHLLGQPLDTVLGKDRFNYFHVHNQIYHQTVSFLGWTTSNSDTERNLKKQLYNYNIGIGAHMYNTCLELMAKLFVISVKEIMDSKEK